MLNYEEFKEKIKAEILTYLPKVYEGSEIKIIQAIKTNDHKLDGLMIRRRKCNVAPNIYLNAFYADYTDGRPIEDIMMSIAEIRVHHDVDTYVDAEEFLGYEKIKDHIYMSVINYERNPEILKDRPYRRFLDLAITYYVNISECDTLGIVPDGRLVMNMTNELMEEFNITEEELYDIAKRNTSRKDNVYLSPLQEELRKRSSGLVFDDPFGKVASILTNKDALRGAALIACDNVLKDLADKYDTDIYVFPLSVDEVIVVPEYEVSLSNVIDMDPDDFGPFSDGDEYYLSNRVYYYARNIGKITIVECSKEVKV